MIEGISGVVVMIHVILIAGKDIEHHDKILQEVIGRATESNLKLNFDKCCIGQSSVLYMGHVISHQGLEPDPEKVRAITGMPPPKRQRRS